jgi:PAS domain S-box-containing protein
MQIDKSSIGKVNTVTWIWNPASITNMYVGLNWLLAAVLVTAATCANSSFFTNSSGSLSFQLYFGAIVLSAAFGGTRSAFAAVILSCLSVFLVFIYPAGPLNLQAIPLMQLASFLLEALLVVLLVDIVWSRLLLYKREEQRYRGIIEKSYEGFFMTDSDTKITYTCPSTSVLLGYSEQELKQLTYFGLIDTATIKDFKIRFNNLLAIDDASLKLQHQLKTKDGSWIWAETVIKNLLNDPHVNRVVYHFTNVTKKINEEQQQEDFVNIASHELKNPITALSGYMQMLKRRFIGNDDVAGVLGRMEKQIRKLEGIISDMLDNTKIKAGEIQYVISTFDINECIQEAVDAAALNLSSHQINCMFESPQRFIDADRERIGQVITNLITNAIKYSPAGKMIDISTRLVPSGLETRVTDYGIGIAKEKQKHLFERFYRVDTLPKKLAGLGLGLFISAEIVRRHNGKINVESDEGKGSTFWFTLPIK